MVLTKQDLQDWNSNEVTRAVFAGIKNSLAELSSESCIRATADETAMKTAFNEGVAEGINSLVEGYEILVEDSE